MRTYWCVLRIFHVCVQLVVQAGAFGTTSALGHIWRMCPQHLRCRVTVSRFSLKYLRLPTCWKGRHCDGGFPFFLLQKKPWKNICHVFCLLHRFKEEGFHSNAVKISPHVKPSQVPAACHCHVFFCNLAAKGQTDLCKI